MADVVEAGIGIDHPGKQADARALAGTLNGSEQFFEVAEVALPAGRTLVANESVAADERDVGVFDQPRKPWKATA